MKMSAKMSDRFALLMPTFAHFARCWKFLHRKASRRTLEVAMAWLMVSQILRLAQSLRWLPAPELARGPDTPAARLILASNDFYASIWPSGAFWVALLSAGLLCAVAGMLQVVAAVQLTRARGDLGLLAEAGEDDDRYFSSVNERWLLADVLLRRAAMAVCIAFFATFSWELLVHTGPSSLLFIVLLVLSCWVDNRLADTMARLKARLADRRDAEKAAMKSYYDAPSLK